MWKFAKNAIDTATSLGADYADIRIMNMKSENLLIRNGEFTADISDKLGFGIRVIYKGAWGFAASDKVNSKEIKKVAIEAVNIAKASKIVQDKPVKWAKEPPYQDHWFTPILKNPFLIPLEKKLEFISKIEEILRKKKEIKVAEVSMYFDNARKWFANSEGSEILQDIIRSGAGYSVFAVGNNDMQKRSFPASFGGQYYSGGYEVIETMGLLENAERIRDEAIQLLKAKECPNMTTDLILDGSQLVLQIHESVGHATELDRVLGFEANYAGRSFATKEKYNKFQYGSKIVNLV
ncbi:TldD/PmbA family protein, partial [candidate division WOR-3 bacterium]|nr:TldD/PmbA family protein [candidate division WOR-3 bacterium]